MDQVLGVYFLPPLAIARVGGSDTPIECFHWERDETIHGAHRTVIRPSVTLEVLSDESLRPYRPNSIQFRDRELLRPVAPFFELWATMQSERGLKYDTPITLGLVDQLGTTIDSIKYSITVANRKAQRRTGSAACAFEAHVNASAGEYGRRPLLAFSPHNPAEEPLVFRERPIPLGHFQVLKPTPSVAMGVDLSILRVRFIPARGYVYGPPDADAGPASPLPPGGALPFQTLGGALHEIVPKQNRFLNPNTPWSHYTMDGKCQQDPQPSDSYDGANVGSNRSWGVVDDTCDGLIQADVVVGGQRFGATTRVFSCCPDFAPDRRPFFSLTDDLADRDQHPMPEFLEGEIADLFVRVFETASTVNLNATRDHGINENMTDPPPSNYSGLPEIGWKSMTKDDRGYVDLLNQREMLPSSSVPRERLGYAAIAREAHAPLCDLDSLIDLLRSKKEYVQRLIRPPFGHFRELETDPGPKPNPRFRDPRVPRDTLNDMRMPPYMRDSDETPLSITYRQYQALMKYIDQLTAAPQLTTTGAGVPRSNGPVSRRISRLVKRLSLKLSND